MQKLIACLMLVSMPALSAGKTPEPPKAEKAPAAPPASTPVPDGAPSAANGIEEPSITIRNQGRERIEEYRLRGKLYMIRVVPPKGPPYYLVDQLGRGEFTRHEGPTPPTAPPQWVIRKF